MTRLTSRILAATAAAVALATTTVALGQTPAPAPAQASAPAQCTDCGKVLSIKFVQEEGKASGLGAVVGGVAGGVIGHQIGGGVGQTVATIAGAGGGAYVGNKIEKSKNTKAYWQVVVKMDGGATRTLHFTNQPTVNEGERVKLIDGGRRLALVAN